MWEPQRPVTGAALPFFMNESNNWNEVINSKVIFGIADCHFVLNIPSSRMICDEANVRILQFT